MAQGYDSQGNPVTYDPLQGPPVGNVPTWTAPPPSGGSQPWFSVGYPGTVNNKPQAPRAPWGGGMPIGSPGWLAVTGAAGQADQSFQQGLGRLAPGQYTGGQFGQFLQGQFGGGLGMDPRALEAQRRMAAEMEAGSRQNALTRMGQQAAASGFGDSVGLMDAQGRLRTQSAANLQNTYDQLFIQQQLMQQQQKQAAAQLYSQLMGLEAGQQGMAAQLLANRQFPAIPGYGPQGAQTTTQPSGGGSAGGSWQTGPLGYGMWVPTGSQPTGYNSGSWNPGWY